MPFILIVGLPSSGKTTRVNQLVEYLSAQSKIFHIIKDSSYIHDKNVTYSDSHNEKELRGTLKSEVQKLISKETTLILDASNYIKGFRYELFCVTKLAQTPQCVIFIDTEFELCLNWNEKRPQNETYSIEIMKALNMRFEPPEAKNRWDSPLIRIKENDELPFEEIRHILYNTRAAPPNKSTLNKILSDSTFLLDIDKTTQDIIMHLVGMQQNNLASAQLIVPHSNEKVNLTRPTSIAELRKWRGQFLNYIKMHPPGDASLIGNMFVQYLNNFLTK